MCQGPIHPRHRPRRLRLPHQRPRLHLRRPHHLHLPLRPVGHFCLPCELVSFPPVNASTRICPLVLVPNVCCVHTSEIFFSEINAGSSCRFPRGDLPLQAARPSPAGFELRIRHARKISLHRQLRLKLSQPGERLASLRPFDPAPRARSSEPATWKNACGGAPAMSAQAFRHSRIDARKALPSRQGTSK